MSATKALQQWCKQQCEGYRDVSITNMTTSFRDGLAFCAILHRHRPDLINFNALHKENVYENNQLAFKVAEMELGIPALLDAEDMVALKVPDRLSILTYVSQYYNYFHGRSPIGGMAGVKRSPSISSEEPAGKKVVPEPVLPAPAKPSPVHTPSEPKTNPALKGKENAPVEAVRSNPFCLVGCKQCSNTLKSGNYKVGSDPGTFICNQHKQPMHLQNSLHGNTRSILGENKPTRPPSTPGIWLKEVESQKPGHESRKPSQAPQSNDAVKAPIQERSNFENHKSVSVAANPSSRWLDMNKGNKLGRCENSIASPFSSHWTPSSAKTQQAREKFFQASPLPADKTQPIQSRGTPLNTSQGTGRTSFPGPGTNASSSEKDRARNILLHALPAPQPSTNKPESLSTIVGKPTPAPSGLQHLKTKNLPTSEISRPAGVLSATEKPRRDPLGTPHVVESLVQDPGNRPGIRTATQIRVKVANGQNANTGHKVDIKVTEVYHTDHFRFRIAAPSSDPTPKKKLLVPHPDVSSGWPKVKQQWEDPSPNQTLEVPSLPKRAIAPDDTEDALMVEWFKLIHEKQLLLRRESELMHKMNQQKLEEKQWDIETELRTLMSKSDSLKTPKEKTREEELLKLYLETVNDRNKIVEDLDEDRLRELEEDEVLAAMIQKLDGPRNTPESEKKKTKFGFFKILKTKN
ncbi:hypothetical protein JD844_020014 [Phrynosoma platyrhinos]|uniref:MICAL-like protein 2 n=1 Tax=Phrynosoma platyrhinos TaxID=52577 RepID=A0ABQ7TRI5_PHRPL|nr:hypothetical protein JD844_020014 [Phrynosoma platyrhinos]